MSEDLILGVSDFVALLNQTLEFAYPSVVIVGELANLRISKNRWVYFDLKDEYSSVKFFGTVYQLPGPLEDGLTLQVRGTPRLHPLYGFSVTVTSMQPMGEGSIKKAAALLEAKLTAEGLFNPARKRTIPYPPASIGLITSSESAAYRDFIKILTQRWGGIDIRLHDVQVQGEAAVAQIVTAIEYFNNHANPPEVLVVTRGGGSADDLAAFSTEQVTRAVAGSRIPTVVAIGHEVDVSLAELAADQRASTPSNAAELLVPDRKAVTAALSQTARTLASLVKNQFQTRQAEVKDAKVRLAQAAAATIGSAQRQLESRRELLLALSPAAVLRRGYAIVRANGKVVRAPTKLAAGAEIDIELDTAVISAQTRKVKLK